MPVASVDEADLPQQSLNTNQNRNKKAEKQNTDPPHATEYFKHIYLCRVNVVLGRHQ